MTAALAAALARARRALVPPQRLALSEWAQEHVRLPEGATALPGPLRLFPYQRAVADAIGDPTLERVTLVKPVRVGFTTLLSCAVGHFAVNDPCQVLVLQPTTSDARDYVVSDLEPLFAATLRSAIGRNSFARAVPPWPACWPTIPPASATPC